MFLLTTWKSQYNPSYCLTAMNFIADNAGNWAPAMGKVNAVKFFVSPTGDLAF